MGSEMCIRDSAGAERRSAGARAAGGAGVGTVVDVRTVVDAWNCAVDSLQADVRVGSRELSPLLCIPPELSWPERSAGAIADVASTLATIASRAHTDSVLAALRALRLPVPAPSARAGPCPARTAHELLVAAVEYATAVDVAAGPRASLGAGLGNAPAAAAAAASPLTRVSHASLASEVEASLRALPPSALDGAADGGAAAWLCALAPIVNRHLDAVPAGLLVLLAAPFAPSLDSGASPASAHAAIARCDHDVTAVGRDTCTPPALTSPATPPPFAPSPAELLARAPCWLAPRRASDAVVLATGALIETAAAPLDARADGVGGGNNDGGDVEGDGDGDGAGHELRAARGLERWAAASATPELSAGARARLDHVQQTLRQERCDAAPAPRAAERAPVLARIGPRALCGTSASGGPSLGGAAAVAYFATSPFCAHDAPPFHPPTLYPVLHRARNRGLAVRAAMRSSDRGGTSTRSATSTWAAAALPPHRLRRARRGIGPSRFNLGGWARACRVAPRLKAALALPEALPSVTCHSVSARYAGCRCRRRGRRAILSSTAWSRCCAPSARAGAGCTSCSPRSTDDETRPSGCSSPQHESTAAMPCPAVPVVGQEDDSLSTR